MSSAFNLLTSGGAKFIQRYHADMNLFVSKGGKDKGKARAVSGSSAQKAQGIPSNLDFFGAGPSSAPAETIDDEEEEENSMESDDEQQQEEAPAPRHKVIIDGPEPLPASIPNVDTLTLKSTSPDSLRYLSQNLAKAGVSSLWGVQCAVAGCLMDKRDTMVVAPTGSGKTLSYLLPLFVALEQPCRNLKGDQAKGIRSVVVVPTYDLAVQIQDVALSLARGRKWRVILLGKATEHAVIEACDTTDEALGIDLLICTPERMHHLIGGYQVSLARTQMLVLDEADRLLADEFKEQTLPIVKACGKETQKCFLSATIPSSVEADAKTHLKGGGTRVVVGVKDAATSNIAQSLLYTGSESGKMMALRSLIATGGLPYPSLIFVQSIERANELYRSLVLDGLLVDVVHGERSKSQREQAVKAFREGRIWVLVVTDVLARGMDFRGVKVVINYDFPQTVQSYIHRIGRTGRAGRPGQAITYFSIEDGPHLRTVANVLRASGCEVPQYMLDMPKPSKNMKKKLRQRPIERKQIGGAGRNLAREDAKRKKDIRSGTVKRAGMKSKSAANDIDMDE